MDILCKYELLHDPGSTRPQAITWGMWSRWLDMSKAIKHFSICRYKRNRWLAIPSCMHYKSLACKAKVAKGRQSVRKYISSKFLLQSTAWTGIMTRSNHIQAKPLWSLLYLGAPFMMERHKAHSQLQDLMQCWDDVSFLQNFKAVSIRSSLESGLISMRSIQKDTRLYVHSIVYRTIWILNEGVSIKSACGTGQNLCHHAAKSGLQEFEEFLQRWCLSQSASSCCALLVRFSLA